MCNECWKEFKGWCKAFTQTEVVLAILEAVLLSICIAFLIFLILHIIVCASWQTREEPIDPTKAVVNKPSYDKEVTGPPYRHTTLDPAVKCTWKPSKKTEAPIHYYEGNKRPIIVLTNTSRNKSLIETHQQTTMLVNGLLPDSTQSSEEPGDVDSLAFDERSDGEEADNEYKSSVVAVVKLRPPRDVSFGCIAAVISERWAVTAASCVEAVEETDSLDNFVLMERYGAIRRGRTHAIADVQLHPLYQGSNRSYDIAALRSEDALQPAATPLALPPLVDYFLLTVGERLSLLGFGSFRTVDQPSAERSLRSVVVYALPGETCLAAEGAEAGGGAEGWAPRHLSRGRQDDHAGGGCGAAALCAGVRYARGSPCTYCAGSPLVRGGALLGVMSSPRACAVSCEPTRFANLATPPVASWLRELQNSAK